MLSFKLIPFAGFIGLDFQNLYAFHNSVSPNDPYSITGAEAGDVGKRDMIYPPLLYFLFTWTRFVPFSIGYILWSAIVCAITLGCFSMWVNEKEIKVIGIAYAIPFIVLLTAQFPVSFAIERGNNDVLVLLSWSLSYFCYKRDRYLLSGALAGLAAAMKLYPIFACAIVLASCVVAAARYQSERKKSILCILGGFIAVLSVSLVFWPQTKTYFFSILPRIQDSQSGLVYYAHSLRQVFVDYSPRMSSWGNGLLSAALLAAWLAAGVRLFRKDPALVFAGGLALSTYFSGISYDYNLMTAFPLLFILYCRSIYSDAPSSNIAFILLLVGLFAVIGYRGLFMASKHLMQFHILLQWFWVVAVAVLGEATREPIAIAYGIM